ncbi:pancreatic lipase-related protein 2-like [Ischnura elegans]|uniref:pancreatic lipase-related protein 2-like n=1 Tax=Ischnura elegans TaxID=197161 RepID=UPI001ED8755F|nr:pancreatic lipase-related protein 2-like [Ischnura elegans]
MWISKMALDMISCLATALLVISPGVLSKSITPEREAKAGLFSREVDQKCFLRIGCLNTTQDWYNALHRPVNFQPESPSEIGVTFTLHTRENLRGEVITVDEKEKVPSTFYKGNRKTKFIIHGFLGSAEADWVQDIMDALLTRMNINVVTVDWSKGAGMPYNQAAVNTRVVGLEIAYLVNTLIKTRGASADSFHLIGHSLGAHTAGYAGERIPGLGRITGLDPAGPWFTDMPNYVRLDTKDAKFVDIIHTDAELIGFGIEEAIGHVDFFPNGGYRQPGCSIPMKMDISEMVDAVSEAPSCSHSRSELLFLESITSSPFFEEDMAESYGEELEESDKERLCPFTAFLCDSYESFLEGSCTKCGDDGMECALMGLDADKYPGKNNPTNDTRKFFLQTNSDSPFCGYHYAVNARLPADYKAQIPAIGDLIITASGEDGVAKKMDLTEIEARKMYNGSSYNFLGFSSTDTGKIGKAEVTWKWNPGYFSKDNFCFRCITDLYLSKLEVTNLGYYPGNDFKKSSTCPNDPTLFFKNRAATTVNLKC